MDLLQYENVIWDWNGTVIDDVDLCYEIFMEQRALFNLHYMDLETYRYNFTFPVEDFYKFAGFSGTSEEYEKLAGMFIRTYNAKRVTCSVHKGVMEILNSCKEGGVSSFVLSAYENNSLLSMVESLSMGHYFTSVFGLTGVHAGSKLYAGKELLHKYTLVPGETLYIGDTVHDFEVASALGVDVVLTANGHNCRKRLEKDCEGALIVDSLEQLGV